MECAADLQLLSGDLNGTAFRNKTASRLTRPLWLTPGDPVPLGHLCAASAQLGITIPEAVDRLRRLGIDVPDAQDAPRTAMARLPRRRREENPARRTPGRLDA